MTGSCSAAAKPHPTPPPSADPVVSEVPVAQWQRIVEVGAWPEAAPPAARTCGW
ncbi:hypothetical protein AB0L71_02255 [Streptomyces sp. NPDC052052]|uniref:hypothetical protein n=1 Tax=Streptomyces sp. NPDC052052 TaxID=3154756 RepID=UPI0034227396